ncbi:Stp1/IreP family PP2C-type Ser/Thr phosphatase [Actinomadura harenae]|uniref:Serine/threonine protein phosphatase PstP n=1 Tax=Actinomadura harenae TaxID=2483351 RepID=A0A3M2LX64_9ACTN|nr:Stp1/IreP family PP2C-type Ser/Thr phosphatase [Actinomadura harenae]RMI41500.1 Stp1/IreP family PP2C-type Ser/Thr phosphatase [Actinomadura harenae]
MTLGIRYSARSDVGMLREGNEDSGYAGTHLLAVADGMGGHVGGEIASAAAISEIRKLDKAMPATELLAALEHTVKAANENLHRIVESDPALQGMGTTLTAMLWAGNQIALVHIGDSRAYLLRDGSLFQITHDHTLVQSLVDEGRISPDEAASHPQRSLLLRAMDGRGEIDPDLSLREAKAGDRYLLCSDGLSTVVTAETIFQVLTDAEDTDHAVRQLIDLANRGGGPDNITCVCADVVELGDQPPPPSQGRAVGAAASAGPPPVPGDPNAPGGPGMPPGPGMPGGPGDTPASRAAQLRDTMPQQPVAVDERPPMQHPGAPQPGPGGTGPQATVPDPRYQEPQQFAAEQQFQPAGRRERRAAKRAHRGPRRWLWLVVVAGVFVVAVAGGGVFFIQTARAGYYVGEQNGNVVLFRGTTQKMPLISLSRKADEQPNPPIKVSDLPQDRAQAVRATYTVKGPQALDDLVKAVCKYSLRDEGGKVAIKRGVEQSDCAPTTVKPGTITVSELPTSDQNSVRDGKFTYVGVAGADKKIAELSARVDLCRGAHPTIKDCPAPSRGRS